MAGALTRMLGFQSSAATPSYVASGAHSPNSLVANYPASIASGDFLIASIVGNGTADMVYNAPAGWTRLAQPKISSGTNNVTIAAFYKVADGSESGTVTFTLGIGTSNQQTATVSRFSGVTSFESIVAGGTTNSTTTAISSPAVTTTGANRLIVNIFGTNAVSALTEEAGWTEAFDYTQDGTGASDYSQAMHYAASSGTGVQTTEEPTPAASGIPCAIASLALMPSGSLPTPSISVRQSRISHVVNTNSIAFSFPTGSQAGDLCVIFTEHGFVTTTPSGWLQLSNLTGSNVNGACFHKILTAADISTGSVTISFSGSYYGEVAGITFVGCTGGLRTTTFSRNSTSASSRSLTTDGTPKSGDYAVYFGSERLSSTTVTIDKGSALQTDNSGLNASGALYGGTIGADGAITANYTYSASGTGDYQGIVVIAPC
jgi:hypothetical protein